MDETTFWRVMDESRVVAAAGPREGSQDRQVATLEELLSELSAQELVEFRNWFYYFTEKTFTWDHMAVAYIIGDGATDDYFNYFQAWLVSMGREGYEAVLRAPELADDLQRSPGVESIFFELITYVPGRLYEQKTGNRIPYPETQHEPAKNGPIGNPWSTEHELRERFPRLFAKYNDH